MALGLLCLETAALEAILEAGGMGCRFADTDSHPGRDAGRRTGEFAQLSLRPLGQSGCHESLGGNRAAIIAGCSGSVLLLGFLLMFSRARFRAIWIVVVGLCLLASALGHPSVLLLVAQSALSGVVLTLLGFVIQRLIERARSSGVPAIPMPLPARHRRVREVRRSGLTGWAPMTPRRSARASSPMDHAPQAWTLSRSRTLCGVRVWGSRDKSLGVPLSR